MVMRVDWTRNNGRYREGIKTAPVQNEFDHRSDIERVVPFELSAEAYKEYEAQFGGGQSHERLLERGGFGTIELAMLLFERIKRLERSVCGVSSFEIDQ
jgi:hypothetical protein